MENFLEEIQQYAKSNGIKPATVVQNSGCGNGLRWGEWVSGNSFPTLKTVDKIRSYMRENPASKKKGAA